MKGMGAKIGQNGKFVKFSFRKNLIFTVCSLCHIHPSPKETQVPEGCISFGEECISENLTSCIIYIMLLLRTWQKPLSHNWHDPGSASVTQGQQEKWMDYTCVSFGEECSLWGSVRGSAVFGSLVTFLLDILMYMYRTCIHWYIQSAAKKNKPYKTHSHLIRSILKRSYTCHTLEYVSVICVCCRKLGHTWVWRVYALLRMGLRWECVTKIRTNCYWCNQSVWWSC